jgi:hypothetical protein
MTSPSNRRAGFAPIPNPLGEPPPEPIGTRTARPRAMASRPDPLTIPFVVIICTTLTVGLIMAMVVVMTN